MLPRAILKPVLRLLLLAMLVVAGQASLASTASAAVSYVNRTCNSIGITPWPWSYALARPASIAAGDVLVATIRQEGAVVPYGSPPAGWTEVDELSGSNTVTYFKIAGTEPASYTFASGFTGTGTIAGGITAFRGASTTDPIIRPAVLSTGTADPVPLPDTVSERSGSLRYSWTTFGASRTANFAGMTAGCAENGGATFHSAHELMPTAGPTTSRTDNLNSSGSYAAATMIVQPPPPPPTITSLAPSVGPTTAGTTVTITGTDFNGATAVTFGGTAAVSRTVVNGTTITAVAPARAAGTYDVRVTTPSGTSADAGADDDYTYQAAPTVTAVSPGVGPTAGGTSVTITGTGFTNLSGGAAAVRFGTTNATTYTVVNATTITATAPAGTGTADVRVTTVGGTSANSTADDFVYLPRPAITAISPRAGPEAGGTVVTITGTGFTNLSGAGAVQFGGVDAATYTVVNATTITATAPAGTGTADVTVTNPGGTSANVAADDFTYHGIPTITALSPAVGTTAGGTVVTITGTNFAGLTGAAAVRFGAANAIAYTVVNATTITATAPAGTGAVSVRVTTPGGTTADTAADDYTYVPTPAITAISPATGPAPGGTVVAITGGNLGGATQVRFGAIDAATYTVVNATTITATAPAGTGTVDVRVVTPGGTTPNSSADDFTYIPPPTVTALAPSSGPATGGATVTITGTTFTGATQVRFGATDATGFTVVSATTITATAPAGTGTADVRVVTPSGTSANGAADDYAYVGAPTITALSPGLGPSAGGTVVTITGTNFTGASAVRFGATNATGYTVVSPTTITATAPAGTGLVDVRVTTVGGTSADSAADDYRYSDPPVVSAISPSAGPAAGGTTVTITGSFLTGATGVAFGATPAASFLVVNATTITAVSPAGTGIADLRVTTPAGTSANTAADNFTYVAAPVVTGLAPSQGPVVGGTVVTITGTGFTGATAVRFDATNAIGYTVLNATTILATAPPHGIGTVDVTVTTVGGTSANTAADDYEYRNACSLGAMGVTADDVVFTPFTLDGRDHMRTATARMGVSDLTGAGAGWKLEVGAAPFTAGPGKQLMNAPRIRTATATPRAGMCTAPTRTVSTFPILLPESPSKVKVYDAAVGTGLGAVDIALGVELDVPANTLFGMYRSTWTVDLTAAP